MPAATGARPIDVLLLGRIIKGKRVFLLANALAATRPHSALQNLNVVIAGRGPWRAALCERLAALSLASELPGIVKGKDLRTLYAAAKLFVMPSTKHPESIGMVVAEALASGTSAVVCDQPAVVETTGSAGLVCRTGSVSEFAEAIRTVLCSPALWQRLQLAALAERERCTLSMYCRSPA